MKLREKQIAVITGAASGIGLALVEALLRRGLSVAMLDIEAEPLEANCRRLAQAGGDVLAVRTDVRSFADFERARDRVLARFGRIDFVCNNAGVKLPFGPLWEVDPEGWKWLCSVNQDGVFYGMRAFAPLLVEQGSGHMVNVASMTGVTIVPHNSAYNATKHAVVALSNSLQSDLQAAGVDVGVTVVCTGQVRTPLRDGAGRTSQHGVTVEAPRPPVDAAKAPPLEPSDVARMIVEGVELDRSYVFTNPGAGERIWERVIGMVSDLTPEHYLSHQRAI